jgi:transposase
MAPPEQRRAGPLQTARHLTAIPSVGPITAPLVAAILVDIGRVKSARHFAAWLGLVSPQYSTGGKTRLGRIAKTGNREIRRLVALGAMSMVYRAPQWNSVVGVWTRGVLERRPVRLVTVELPNGSDGTDGARRCATAEQIELATSRAST